MSSKAAGCVHDFRKRDEITGKYVLHNVCMHCGGVRNENHPKFRSSYNHTQQTGAVHRYPIVRRKEACLRCGKPRSASNEPCATRRTEWSGASASVFGSSGGEMRLESVEGVVLSYDTGTEMMRVWKPGKWGGGDQMIGEECLAGKNVRAEMISRGTPGKALKASAGGLLAGATIFPVVGTVYGIARGISRARAVAVSMVGDGINWAFETHDRAGAMHFVNTINQKSSSIFASGNPQAPQPQSSAGPPPMP